MFVEMDPIKFIEQNFELNGKHFTLIDDNPENARHYVRGLYYAMTFQLPKVQKPMVIVKGRQVEMSTNLSNIIAYFTETYPYFKTLYVCPALEQIKRFSGEKIAPLLRYKKNPNILKALKSSGDIEGTFTIKMKQFENGSTIYLEAASDEGNNIRNIAAEALIKDEYQDLDENAEGNIDSVLDHSKYNIDISLGTPKYTDTQYENKWKNSTQHYYHLQCPICKHWFILSIDLMVRGFVCACPKCKNQEDKRLLMPHGKWISTQPTIGGKESTYIGYHLSQLYVPYKSIEIIHQKIEEKTKLGIDVTKYTKNEVLGEFYTGITQRPPREAIEKTFVSDMPYNYFTPYTQSVYAGVDWGGASIIDTDPTLSLSIFAAGSLNHEGVLVVSYVEVLDQPTDTEKAERVAQLMEEKRIRLCIADSGYGKTQGLVLGSEFPGRFLKCKYIQGSSMTLLDTKSENDRGVIKANIDYTLEELYGAMMADKLKIPLNEHTEWMKEHFLNYDIQIQEAGNHTHKHFIKKKKKRVDAVHACNFLRLAALHDTNSLEHSNLARVDEGSNTRSHAMPMLTGHTLEEMRMRAKYRPRQGLQRSIQRTTGE